MSEEVKQLPEEEGANVAPKTVESPNQPRVVNEKSGPGSKRPKNKKLLMILATIIVIVVGLVLFLMSDKKSPTIEKQTTSSSAAPNNQTSQIANQAPDKIVYSYAGGSSPQSFYWRPSSGGDRIEANKLGAATTINNFAVRGQQVAVVTSPSYSSSDSLVIWYSSDSGQHYSKLFTGQKITDAAAQSDQITSLIFANDGRSILFGYLPSSGSKNTVKQIALDGSNKTTDLLTSDKSGIFLKSYNTGSKQLLYFDGCYNCDGNTFDKLMVTDITRKTSKALVDGQGASLIVTVNNAATEALILTTTIDKTLQVGGLPGYYSGPPYQLSKLNIASGQQSSIATIGKKSFDKTSQTVSGTISFLGYMNDDKTPYYVIDKQLYKVSNGQPELAFQADKSILGIYYVSTKTILATSGSSSDFNLTTFDGNTKATNILLNGDSQTYVFGITTK